MRTARCGIHIRPDSESDERASSRLLEEGTNLSLRAQRTSVGFVTDLERAMGFEPTTPTLARLCSTPELRPRSWP
jgi:hypothetical protein